MRNSFYDNIDTTKSKVTEAEGIKMENQQLLEYINLFREKAEKGKIIVFVGSGVSCNIEEMPSWHALVQEMANAIGYSKCSTCRHKEDGCADTCLLANDFSTDEFLKIPQFVYNKDKDLYYQVLEDNLPDVVTDAPLSSAIFDINPVHIITTNYDTLLESSKNEFCEQYQVIVHDKDLLNAEKSKYIIKMHGDLSQLKDTIVFKEQDYLDYSQKHVLIELFLKSLLTDHTILFLGYSLNDYNIKLIISWLNYMRSQNDALNDDQKVGYIVLDDEYIDELQVSYFAGNNIGVININEMPQIKSIPASLSNDKGKRLYSFLRIIADPSLEEGLASLENSVCFMSQHTLVDYQQILKLLYVKQYEKIDSELRLFSEDDFDRLVQFMNLNNLESFQLKQLFINAGVLSIFFLHANPEKRFIIGEISDNSLLKDELYSLYIQNKYDEIKALLENGRYNPSKKYFYQSIISGYNNALVEYENIDFSTLNLDQKVAYLHNSATIDAFRHFRFDSSKVTHFIENIASSKKRNLFSLYSDIYNGNSKQSLKMKTALDKLKKDVNARSTVHIGGTSCSEIYKIKNPAMTQYFFYYFNHVFFKGFSYANTFFKPYIEAIICANSEQAEEPTHWGDIAFNNTKYSVSFFDVDIISKFISTKDLSELLGAYKIKTLNTSENNRLFLANSFGNLCNSLVTEHTYGIQNSSFSVLANLALLLNLVDLNDECTNILTVSIKKLFDDERVNQSLFSIHCLDFKYSLKAFSSLCNLLRFKTDIEIIKKIIGIRDFFEYAINVDFYSLRNLVMSFLSKDDVTDIQSEIKDIIEDTENFYHKVIVLRLVYRRITDKNIRNYYSDFLSSNFLQLDTHAVYDFVFDGWLVPSRIVIEAFLSGILEAQRSRKDDVYSFPDPIEKKLECAYLLYINDIITDISILNDLTNGREHLQFLLDPESFDYKHVDFSNYMWQNFARYEKYMTLFIAHKDDIKPQIKARIYKGNASETEKIILYKFFLSDDEVWKF